METYMKVNGKMISKKEKGQCAIRIKINMKDCGIKVKKMDLESTTTIMELFMKVILSMEEKMDLERYHSLMALKLKQTGIRLIWKDKGKYFIRMEIFLKESIISQKNTVRDSIFGVMTKPDFKEILKKILYKVRLKFILLINNTITVE